MFTRRASTSVESGQQASQFANHLWQPHDGEHVVDHGKFESVARFVIVTNANFPWRADNPNVDFGVRIEHAGMAQSIEGQLSKAETIIFNGAKAADIDG